MRRNEIARKFDEIVAFAEVEQFIDTPVKHYSSGMYLRLAFAVAAHLEPEILLVDEVLAVGDAEFQKKCLGKMRSVAEAGARCSSSATTWRRSRRSARGASSSRTAAWGSTARPHRRSTTTSTRSAPRPVGREQHVLYDGQVGQRPAPGRASRASRFSMPPARRARCPAPGTTSSSASTTSRRKKCGAARWSSKSGISGISASSSWIRARRSRCAPARTSWIASCRSCLSRPASSCWAQGSWLGPGWIWRDANLAPFRVHPRDVLELGRAPVLSRMTLVLEQKWSEGASRSARGGPSTRTRTDSPGRCVPSRLDM